jgi:hypothetical protein
MSEVRFFQNTQDQTQIPLAYQSGCPRPAKDEAADGSHDQFLTDDSPEGLRSLARTFFLDVLETFLPVGAPLRPFRIEVAATG